MVIRYCKENTKAVVEKVLSGKLDCAAISQSNLVDDIILAMHTNDILKCLRYGIPDKRADNRTIPFELVIALAVAAKMKVRTALTDIPFAISDHRVLNSIGYSMFDTEGSLGKAMMREGSLRHLIGMYSADELFEAYNRTVQKFIFPTASLSPNIHILDCTLLEVEKSNNRYENSVICKNKDGVVSRGYKLSTLRGLVGDTGIIEDIRFSGMNVHDLSLSEEMLKTSPVLKLGDCVLADRGFLSREILNYMKSKRGVDIYIPLKTNMDAYHSAVSTAKKNNNWIQHPNKKRPNQKIALVKGLGEDWCSKNPSEDVDFNASVIWFTDADEYAVIVTTDISANAKQIIRTYELRSEIEEDYRILKDHFNLAGFTSTKLCNIAFHIVTSLFGYLFFQIYTMLPDGEQYLGKSLPCVTKNYVSQALHYVVLYVGTCFGVITLLDLMKLYSSMNVEQRAKIESVLCKI